MTFDYEQFWMEQEESLVEPEFIKSWEQHIRMMGNRHYSNRHYKLGQLLQFGIGVNQYFFTKDGRLRRSGSRNGIKFSRGASKIRVCQCCEEWYVDNSRPKYCSDNCMALMNNRSEHTKQVRREHSKRQYDKLSFGEKMVRNHKIAVNKSNRGQPKKVHIGTFLGVGTPKSDWTEKEWEIYSEKVRKMGYNIIP